MILKLVDMISLIWLYATLSVASAPPRERWRSSFFISPFTNIATALYLIAVFCLKGITKHFNQPAYHIVRTNAISEDAAILAEEETSFRCLQPKKKSSWLPLPSSFRFKLEETEEQKSVLH